MKLLRNELGNDPRSEIQGTGHKVRVASFTEAVEFYASHCLDLDPSDFIYNSESLEGRIFNKIKEAFAAKQVAFEQIFDAKFPDETGYRDLIAEIYGHKAVVRETFESALVRQLNLVLSSDQFCFSNMTKLVDLVWGKMAERLLSGANFRCRVEADILQLDEALYTLSEREEGSIRYYYGLNDERQSYTLEEVAQIFSVTRERIRQINAKALRKLRHPSRSRHFKDAALTITERVDKLSTTMLSLTAERDALEERVRGLTVDLDKTVLVKELRDDISRLKALNDEYTLPERLEAKAIELIDKSIDECEFSVRTYNCLKNSDIRSIRHLTSKSVADLLRTQNFGKKSLTEVTEFLAGIGLSLRDDSHV